jgi:hypothetical protein
MSVGKLHDQAAEGLLGQILQHRPASDRVARGIKRFVEINLIDADKFPVHNERRRAAHIQNKSPRFWVAELEIHFVAAGLGLKGNFPDFPVFGRGGSTGLGHCADFRFEARHGLRFAGVADGHREVEWEGRRLLCDGEDESQADRVSHVVADVVGNRLNDFLCEQRSRDEQTAPRHQEGGKDLSSYWKSVETDNELSSPKHGHPREDDL